MYVLNNTSVRYIASGLLTLYDLSFSDFKFEWTATITRGVEFLSIGQCACEQCVCGGGEGEEVREEQEVEGVQN